MLSSVKTKRNKLMIVNESKRFEVKLFILTKKLNTLIINKNRIYKYSPKAVNNFLTFVNVISLLVTNKSAM